MTCLLVIVMRRRTNLRQLMKIRLSLREVRSLS
nr:MAG TPA: hypothetical protein [Caudoviricetes sp.]